MKVTQNAYAGTLESSDAFVQVMPLDKDVIEIELESSVEEIYGDAIRELIRTVLQKMGVDSARLVVQDKGALDFVLQARVQTAILRACGVKTPDWSTL